MFVAEIERERKKREAGGVEGKMLRWSVEGRWELGFGVGWALGLAGCPPKIFFCVFFFIIIIYTENKIEGFANKRTTKYL